MLDLARYSSDSAINTDMLDLARYSSDSAVNTDMLDLARYSSDSAVNTDMLDISDSRKSHQYNLRTSRGWYWYRLKFCQKLLQSRCVYAYI